MTSFIPLLLATRNESPSTRFARRDYLAKVYAKQRITEARAASLRASQSKIIALHLIETTNTSKLFSPQVSTSHSMFWYSMAGLFGIVILSWLGML